VKEAVPPAAERGRTALRAVYLDVLTSWNIFETHGFLVLILVVFILFPGEARVSPLPPGSLESWGWRGNNTVDTHVTEGSK